MENKNNPTFIISYDRISQSISGRFSFPMGREPYQWEYSAMEKIEKEFNQDIGEIYLYAAIKPELFEQVEAICRDILKRVELHDNIIFNLCCENFDYRTFNDLRYVY